MVHHFTKCVCVCGKSRKISIVASDKIRSNSMDYLLFYTCSLSVQNIPNNLGNEGIGVVIWHCWTNINGELLTTETSETNVHETDRLMQASDRALQYLHIVFKL